MHLVNGKNKDEYAFDYGTFSKFHGVCTAVPTNEKNALNSTVSMCYFFAKKNYGNFHENSNHKHILTVFFMRHIQFDQYLLLI